MSATTARLAEALPARFLVDTDTIDMVFQQGVVHGEPSGTLHCGEDYRKARESMLDDVRGRVRALGAGDLSGGDPRLEELRARAGLVASSPAWIVEDTGCALWVGPGRPNGKVDDIVYAVDLASYRDETIKRRRGLAHLVVTAVNTLLAQPGPVTGGGAAYAQATLLAKSLWERLWKEQTPNWEPLADLPGVLDQIDNMTAGLCRSPFHGEPPPAAVAPRADREATAASNARDRLKIAARPCFTIGRNGYDLGCETCGAYTDDYERSPIQCPYTVEDIARLKREASIQPAAVASPRVDQQILLAALGSPHCWVIPGPDTANDSGYIDAHCTHNGEFSLPLWPFKNIVDAILASIQPQDGTGGEAGGGGWQPIETAKREHYVEVLGWGCFQNGAPFRAIMQWFDAGGDFNGVRGWWTVNALPYEPTHWMPLPAPPSRGEG